VPLQHRSVSEYEVEDLDECVGEHRYDTHAVELEVMGRLASQISVFPSAYCALVDSSLQLGATAPERGNGVAATACDGGGGGGGRLLPTAAPDLTNALPAAPSAQRLPAHDSR
jgi:hypothetical protein